MTAIRKQTEGAGEAMSSEPSFFKWQLLNYLHTECSRDVLDSLLDEDKQYTLTEAKQQVTHFMNRKV
ncbi:hypothetical protein ACFQZE_12685 [Paenibacillus sp. GCM10027627]|uniref:hypothetical protein n=1 Tax=unclassified Paenibacillus TaxID=185978 RepID=UPI0036292B26